MTAVEQNGHRKLSLYFPEEMIGEIQNHASRLDRSLSWVLQRAWKISRDRIRLLPGTNDLPGWRPPSERAPK